MIFLLIMADECIPFIQIEKPTWLGLSHDCVWNTEGLIILGAVAFGLIVIYALFEIINQGLQKGTTKHPTSGFEISNRELFNLNPEKYQKKIFVLVKDIFKFGGYTIVESRSPDYLEFYKGSNWIQGKTTIKVNLSSHNNKLMLYLSSTRDPLVGSKFNEKEIEGINRDFDKIVNDVNKLMK